MLNLEPNKSNITRYWTSARVSETWVIDELKNFVKRYPDGYSYAIVVRDSVGNLSIHERPKLPCYGELRKYLNTHPEDTVTQPHPKVKPFDLHYPFPDGKPEALAIVGPALADETVRRFLVSDVSPFRRGYQLSQLEFATDKEGAVVGIILKDSKFDPTVLVNCMKRAQPDYTPSFKLIGELGLDEYENFILAATLRFIKNWNGGTMVCQTNQYIQSAVCDVTRIMSGESVDLTGGTWGGRYDYNRKDMHNIFRAPPNEEWKNVNLYMMFREESINLGLVKDSFSPVVLGGELSSYRQMFKDLVSKAIEISSRESAPDNFKPAVEDYDDEEEGYDDE